MGHARWANLPLTWHQTLYSSHDPRWTAVHKNDYTNSALQYYNENLATTHAGALNISTVLHDVTFPMGDNDATGRIFRTPWNRRSLQGQQQGQDAVSYKYTDTSTSSDKQRRSTAASDIRFKTKHYQSGMLQGWNKFCFTGRCFCGSDSSSCSFSFRCDLSGM